MNDSVERLTVEEYIDSLLTEIERLRAEIERLQKLTDHMNVQICKMGVRYADMKAENAKLREALERMQRWSRTGLHEDRSAIELDDFDECATEALLHTARNTSDPGNGSTFRNMETNGGNA